jgi:hypothetical protein
MTRTPLDELTIARFEASDIDAARFDHEAHVYVGWLYVRAYPRREALARFDAALRRLVEKIGAVNKYSAMITWLFMLLIAERARVDEDWHVFRARNSDLFDERPGARAA